MRSIQTYARVAGVLFLVSMVAGFFGELYAPSHIIVSGDAAATAKNIVAFNTLFRAGFASYLVEAVCDITLSLVMYELLRAVRKDLALLAAFFGLVSTAVFAIAELFYFGSSLLVGGAGYLKSFSPDQVNALGLLSLKMYGLGGGIFMVFYGLATFLRGYLIYRSGYLPRALGALMALAGLGFIASNFLQVLSPAYAYDVLLLPMFLAGVSATVWLLVKGVDVQKWEARAVSVV
ncbi:MAG: DUF4386 domain-containing protein [Gemmatimonadota bacterium]|nr:DUF4386 domain-containing protein [Gemmatimonadota bacterium]